MVQRWKMSPNQSMVTEPDGGYVEYTDHIAAIKELVSLCLDNGIISRGAACTYLGCAREDLDDMLRVVEDGDAIPVAPAQTPKTDPDS
jgi:hypothetical protein